EEWLKHIVETDLPSLPCKQKVCLGELLTYSVSGGVVCTVCAKAKAGNNFAKGKIGTEWKLDYLKRHLSHVVHIESVGKIHSKNFVFGIQQMLTESPEACKLKGKLSAQQSSKAEQVKILIDNVLLAVQMNVSMSSVQEIHNHKVEYMSIPESWQTKNYTFEFLDSIS
uniref:Uncharacterized protein n=1 Tax=Latimeria chalumnae TaxID=7897 RepID=H3B094_LATCH